MARQKDPQGEEHLYLLTRSSLEDYLSFMKRYPVAAHEANRTELVNGWMTAQKRMRTEREANPEAADSAQIWAIPQGLKEQEQQVLADPIFQQSFSDVSWQLKMINLEQVVVSQKLVSLRHIRELQSQLGKQPSDRDVFRFCLPYDRQLPEHRSNLIDDEEYAFTSDSNDLRFLDAVLLKPDQITGYKPSGPIAGVLALVVGFGANYLHVLSANNRLILNNGHHRACALFDLGIRQVPCVVQTIRHPDEIEVHAPRPVGRNPEQYFDEPRPPLLQDYFDPQLSRVVRLNLTTKQVRITYTVEEKDMP